MSSAFLSSKTSTSVRAKSFASRGRLLYYVRSRQSRRRQGGGVKLFIYAAARAQLAVHQAQVPRPEAAQALSSRARQRRLQRLRLADARFRVHPAKRQVGFVRPIFGLETE